MEHCPVILLDFGSQTTQLIARRIREAHIYCEIHPFRVGQERDLAHIKALSPKAIILSGGPASTLAPDAPMVLPQLFDLGVPVLGICYGMQLMCKLLGGQVERPRLAGSGDGEYGAANLQVHHPSGPLQSASTSDSIRVWMSHGDRVSALPQGFDVLASTDSTACAAMGDLKRRLFGLQFHPEVVHTPTGAAMIRDFLVVTAGITPTWTMNQFAATAEANIISQVKPGEGVVVGLSGGVDSSVAAVLCHRALASVGRAGDLQCLFVDNGLLREGEREAVEALFGAHLHMNLHTIDARELFLGRLAGLSDPERKRKVIGQAFIEVFEREAKRFTNVKHLVQGTLYPDVIESVSVRGPSAVIKSHHNVGGLPERMQLRLLEPLRELFKDEVRALGAELGLAHDLLWRHPFPGPGLAIRCIGEVSADRLQTLRSAEAIVERVFRERGVYASLWQGFGILLPVRSVGVMGDERTYEETFCIRAIHSTDGMTADWARLPYEVLDEVSRSVINGVPGINRVVYDVSSKPPATIEWE